MERSVCARERRTDGQADLEGVHQVFHQEETAQVFEGTVDIGQTAVHVFAERLGGNADVFIHEFPAQEEMVTRDRPGLHTENKPAQSCVSLRQGCPNYAPAAKHSLPRPVACPTNRVAVTMMWPCIASPI